MPRHPVGRRPVGERGAARARRWCPTAALAGAAVLAVAVVLPAGAAAADTVLPQAAVLPQAGASGGAFGLGTATWASADFRRGDGTAPALPTGEGLPPGLTSDLPFQVGAGAFAPVSLPGFDPAKAPGLPTGLGVGGPLDTSLDAGASVAGVLPGTDLATSSSGLPYPCSLTSTPAVRLPGTLSVSGAGLLFCPAGLPMHARATVRSCIQQLTLFGWQDKECGGTQRMDGGEYSASSWASYGCFRENRQNRWHPFRTMTEAYTYFGPVSNGEQRSSSVPLLGRCR